MSSLLPMEEPLSQEGQVLEGILLMKYICKICGGICDPGELAGGICFECRQEDEISEQFITKGDKSMKRLFEFEKRVTYLHSIEVKIISGQEDDFDLFCNEMADKISNVQCECDQAGIIDEFAKKFGKENVIFCEDGSPSVELEAL